MKFCSSCGTASQPDALYCGTCGNAFESAAQALKPNVDTGNQNITVVVKNETKTPIFSIFGICCGVLGIFTLGFVFVPLGFLFTIFGLLRDEVLSAVISGVINFVGLLTSPVLMAALGLGVLLGSANLSKPEPEAVHSAPRQTLVKPNNAGNSEVTLSPAVAGGTRADSFEVPTAKSGTNATSDGIPESGVGPADSKVKALVLAVLTGNQINGQSLVADIKSQPKREHGDRKTARLLNGEALVDLRKDDFAGALKLLMQARDADIGDVEVRENLAYTQMKSGLLDEAEATLMTVFADAPDRASAWGTLGQVFVLRDNEEQAIACMLTAYKYSRNQKRTIEVYQRLVDSDPDVRVQSAAKKALDRLQVEPIEDIQSPTS